MDVVPYGCGLIKDLKTRYCCGVGFVYVGGCGLIKDLKTRYLDNNG